MLTFIPDAEDIAMYNIKKKFPVLAVCLFLVGETTYNKSINQK